MLYDKAVIGLFRPPRLVNKKFYFDGDHFILSHEIRNLNIFDRK
jgi:hypothetical protein